MDTAAQVRRGAHARQVTTGDAVMLESTLRTTLRALAVCAARRADRKTVDQLVARAHDLADRLAAAVGSLENDVAARDARAIAAHLAARLASLEAVAQGTGSPTFS